MYYNKKRINRQQQYNYNKPEVKVEDLFYSSEEMKAMGYRISDFKIEDELSIKELTDLDDLFYGGVNIPSTNNDIKSMDDIFDNKKYKKETSKSYMNKVNNEGIISNNTRREPKPNSNFSIASIIGNDAFDMKELRKDVEPDYRSMRVMEIICASDNYLNRFKDSKDVDKQLSCSLARKLIQILSPLNPDSTISRYKYLVERFRYLYKEHNDYELLRIIVKY